MTAVVTDSIVTFIKWCKKRNIVLYKNNTCIYLEGEVYIPITKESDTHGRIFNGYETIEGIYTENHYDVIDAIKLRIKN